MNPEEKLKSESGKVYLLRSEKNAIRQSILSTTFVPTTRPPLISPFTFLFRVVVMPLCALLVIGVPMTYAAQLSNPGDVLYGVELAMVEPVEELLHFTSNAQAEYHASRLAERLEELQDVSGDEEDINQDLDLVVHNIEAHVEAITTVLASSTEPEKKIKYLVKSKALVEAHGEILEELDSGVDEVDNSSDVLSEELIETSDEYVLQVGEEKVWIAISDTIEEITAVASSSASTTREVIQDQVDDIVDAIERGNVKQALDLANETQAEVLKEQYLDEEE